MKARMEIDYNDPVAEQEIPFRIMEAYVRGHGLKRDSNRDGDYRDLLAEVPPSMIPEFVDDMVYLKIANQVTLIELTDTEKGNYYNLLKSAGFKIESID